MSIKAIEAKLKEIRITAENNVLAAEEAFEELCALAEGNDEAIMAITKAAPAVIREIQKHNTTEARRTFEAICNMAKGNDQAIMAVTDKALDIITGMAKNSPENARIAFEVLCEAAKGHDDAMGILIHRAPKFIVPLVNYSKMVVLPLDNEKVVYPFGNLCNMVKNNDQAKIALTKVAPDVIRAVSKDFPEVAFAIAEKFYEFLDIENDSPVLCDHFARTKKSPGSKRATWFIPKRNKNGSLRSVSAITGRFRGTVKELKKDVRNTHLNERTPDRQHYDSVVDQSTIIRQAWKGDITLQKAANQIETKFGVKYVVLGGQPQTPAA